jgi:large subunit ribosomal protein L21
MKFAIIKTGGKQYKVKENDIVSIEKLEGEPGTNLALETLLTFEEDGQINLGEPSLGEKVNAEILDTEKGKKVSVIKFKNKTRYRRNVGHRQIATRIKITSIS